MLMIDYEGAKDGLRFLDDEEQPHFEFKVRGRTKGWQMEGRSFTMPCVATTGRSGIRPGLWMQRLVTEVRNSGRTAGKLFQRDLEVPRLVEFEDDWYSTLEQVQTRSRHIEDRIDLRREAGILRSLRRGVTSHALNMKVSETLIRAINRWRKERGGTKKGGLPMIDHYAELTTLKKTYLGFSEAL